MTATCTLCGLALTAEPDGILDSGKDDRTFGRLGKAARVHFEKDHANAPQCFVDGLPPSVTVGQSFVILSVTTQAVLINSFLQSADELFLKKAGAMKQILMQAIEQKEPVPQIVMP